MFYSKRSHCNEKPTHYSYRLALARHNERKPTQSEEGLAQPKINTKKTVTATFHYLKKNVFNFSVALSDHLSDGNFSNFLFSLAVQHYLAFSKK